MNKRLLKRHKRQVSRARERVRLSEPDLRTPEQLAAAREGSRAVTGRQANPRPLYSTHIRQIAPVLPQAVRRRRTVAHDPRHCRACRHTLPALQIHRF